MTAWSILSTDEKIAAIAAVYPHTAGTANAIAAGISLELGVEVTRNAVVGIYTRHADKVSHLPFRGMSPEQKRGLPAKQKALRDAVVRKTVNAAPPRPTVAVQPKAAPADTLRLAPLMKTLVDLQCNECKWPENDGGPFLFCGHQQHAGGPYCRYHQLVSVGPGTRSERMASRVSA